jgi:hypothetical protein
MPLYSNFLLASLGGSGSVSSGFPIDWDSDTIKVALFATALSAVVTNSSGYTHWSQIGSAEITGTGYTASGQALSGLSISYNNSGTTTKVKLTASNAQWGSSTLTARYAVIYKVGSSPAASPLICWVDFGADQSSSSGTFEIQWNASGIIEVSAPM